MKIYVSSTYQDLVDHRAAVDRTLRRMGHDVIGMEQYVAEGSKPLNRCLTDIRKADLYVVIVAWRYGYVPPEQDGDGALSITHLELKAADVAKKPILAFLLDPDSPWPPNRVDALGSGANAGAQVAALRSELGTNYLAGIFRSPDDLASQVAAAVSAHGLNQFMVERVLVQTSVSSKSMGAFGEGSELHDSTIGSIKEMVEESGSTRALVIDLGNGDRWWSTRLFLLSSLLQSLTGVRQLVFRDSHECFCGMASPGAVLDRLATEFPTCAQFLAQLRERPGSLDIERETNRQINIWKNLVTGFGEQTLKVGVRPVILERWLGERLIARCIRVDQQGLTMAQVQQIVDSLLPDVPIERVITVDANEKRDLQIVDRDAFALELAREWVRTGIPRNPIR